MMTPSELKALLFDHFANKTTPLQRRLIDEWLTDEANRERYYAWLVEWEHQLPLYEPELPQPLARFEAYMHQNPVGQQPIRSMANPADSGATPKRTPFWWLVAASLVLMLAIGGWLNRDILRYQTYQTAYGQTRTIRLVDGSVVTLNAHSTLRVPRFGFGAHDREVFLRGEAFFAVQHRANEQKFVVQTPNGFEVIVHGTEFNVLARTGRANVMLHKGRIQMDYRVGKKRQHLMLRPGDLVTLNRHTLPKLQHNVSAQPHLAWKEKRFVFDNMPLAEFGQLLHDTYGLRVKIASDTLAQRTLVGSLPAGNADELLRTVSELLDIAVVRQADTVLLKERN